MISSNYMYASSAFQSVPMESKYLKQMDATEKKIVEKEEAEIKQADEKEKNKNAIISSVIIGAFAACFFGFRASDLGYEGWKFVKETVPAIVSFTVGSYIVAKFTSKDDEVRKNVDLGRYDRLNEKIRNIGKKIQSRNKDLSEDEIEELEKANTYFSNRISARSKNGASTHVSIQ